MSAIYKRQNAELSANLTPMIDVTFLLIIFFVVVSQIVEVENAELDLPRPDNAASELPSAAGASRAGQQRPSEVTKNAAGRSLAVRARINLKIAERGRRFYSRSAEIGRRWK